MGRPLCLRSPVSDELSGAQRDRRARRRADPSGHLRPIEADAAVGKRIDVRRGDGLVPVAAHPVVHVRDEIQTMFGRSAATNAQQGTAAQAASERATATPGSRQTMRLNATFRTNWIRFDMVKLFLRTVNRKLNSNAPRFFTFTSQRPKRADKKLERTLWIDGIDHRMTAFSDNGN